MEDETDPPIATTNKKILQADYRQMGHIPVRCMVRFGRPFTTQAIDRLKETPAGIEQMG
jgi:hypothetical protein